MQLSLNDKVLCLSKGLFYEAKIVKVATNDNGEPTKYFVHYQGWNKRYDEWIHEADFPERLKAFQAGAGETQTNKKKKKKESKRKPDQDAEANKENKAGGGSTGNPQMTQFDCQFPKGLQTILLEERDLVENQAKIYNLPAKFTVCQIMADFCYERGGDIQTIQISNILQDIFDRFLQAQLLYEQEKMHYSFMIEGTKRQIEECDARPSVAMSVKPWSMKSDGGQKKASSVKPLIERNASVRTRAVTNAVNAELRARNICGFPHLLRFLTKCEEILQGFTKKTFEAIMNRVLDLALWLEKKHDVYHKPSHDYIAP